MSLDGAFADTDWARYLLGACSSGDSLRNAVVRNAEQVAALRARVAELEAGIPFTAAARVFCEKYLDSDVDMVELRGAEHALIAAYRDTAPTLEKTA